MLLGIMESRCEASLGSEQAVAKKFKGVLAGNGTRLGFLSAQQSSIPAL
jgi:hypothetical protein